MSKYVWLIQITFKGSYHNDFYIHKYAWIISTYNDQRQDSILDCQSAKYKSVKNEIV